MRFGITAKLFLAILLTNIVTAVAVGLGVRAAFDSGFERYIHEREGQRLSRLAEVVGAAYREAGSWDFLRHNDDLWVQLNHAVRPVMPRDGRGPRPGGEARKPPAGWTPGRPPPAMVLDMRGQVVVGDAITSQDIERKEIVVSGQRVGWIASPVRRNVFDIVDRRFQQQVWQSLAIVALLAMALSAIVTWFLARGLLAPVKRIAGATRRLADGDYTTRVVSAANDELGLLVDDFNRLGNALHKNESARRGFMADVSHELRTPLAVLKGELEAIEDGVRAPTPETIRSLQAEVARLGKLVDDIHDLSLADVGGIAYRFRPVDIAALAGETLAHGEGRLTAAGLRATVQGERNLNVRGDSQRLGQLLANLMENTLRYTDAGGELRVSVAREGNKGLLAWEDSKPGVPDEALPRVFDRLYRVESSRNREAGGSGLGLAIARSIVEAHGGTITALASALGGLRIEIRLPLASDGDA
jgi:two-component system, OmpR family, sensor histidine kinase BaeS